MRRLWCLAFVVSLPVAACKIERTPQEYIDHRSPLQQLRQTSADQLDDWLRAFGDALESGDAGTVLQAMEVTPDAYMVTDLRSEPVSGSAEVEALVTELVNGVGPLRVTDSRMTVGPRGLIGWFVADLVRTAPEGGRLQMTGILVRGEEARWSLTQAHLSESPVPPPPYPAGDGAPPGVE